MTTLATGDIALIGYSSDTGGKSFAFVLLRDVDASTAINFTDNGWLAAGGFRANEGTATWTAPAGGATAGTVITISGLTGSLNPSTSGDQILAYQGTAGSPTFLYALDFADGNTSFVGEGGTALGLLETITSPDVAMTLRPGDSLIFYTDGVTERRRGRELFGAARLREAAAPLAGYPAEVMAARLRSTAINFSVEEPRDDIAILVLRNDA